MEVVLPSRYAEWRKTFLGEATERIERDRILEMAGPLEGRRVLDVGCGDGTYLLAAAEAGAEATGVDASREALEAARGRAKERGLQVTLERGDARSLPFADGTFDVVLAVTVLCFIEDAALALREMHRVLRPGGRIVLGELGRWSSWALSRRLRSFFPGSLWRRARFRSGLELSKVLRAARFAVERVEGAVYYPPSGLLLRWLAPLEPRFRRLTTFGAAFVAVAAAKPMEGQVEGRE
jgi:ubiquinone/menaquinone biosynthesis C-methylase UbiE